MRYLTTLILCFCVLPFLPAQKTLPQFSNEIGLDLGHWAKKRPGITLIFKRATGSLKSGVWQTRGAVRILGGYYNETLSLYDMPVRSGDTITQIFTNDPFKRTFFGYGGWEYQAIQGRWRLYFGPDAGYRHSTYTADQEKQSVLQSSGTLLYRDMYQSKVRTHSVQAGVFTGAQFFFAPHWSAGLELNVNAGLDFDRSQIIRDGQVAHTDHETVFVLDARLVRLLYVSWHWGS